jgi:threonyl-tRNA synthetase
MDLCEAGLALFTSGHNRVSERTQRGRTARTRAINPSTTARERRISLAFPMQVVLPDSSQLELAPGATGLDAARAIGPKLAEQAVLIRADGEPQDLRLPLADGQAIQILTTRDRDDPDALSVLRHSSAHLLAEAVRRLYPGVKIAIGPPIENGFYYDFDLDATPSVADLNWISARVRQILQGKRAG